MRQWQAACQPPPSRNGLPWECPLHTPSSFFLVKFCLPLGLPPSFLPSQPLLLISISWNLGLKLNFNSAANTKSCRKKKNTKKFNKKKNILIKKFKKGGGIVISFGVRWLQTHSLLGGENVRGTLLGNPRPVTQSHGPNVVKKSFPQTPKPKA